MKDDKMRRLRADRAFLVKDIWDSKRSRAIVERAAILAISAAPGGAALTLSGASTTLKLRGLELFTEPSAALGISPRR